MSSQHILKISKEYSIYVATNRAIPSIIDSMKHGQRLVLWVLRNKADRIKTMALTGELMKEKLYIHGDQSCNNTINNLCAPYKNTVPFVNGHGFFGSRTVNEFGAARYTEVSRSAAAIAIMYKDLDLLPLQDNYDGSNFEPEFFLPLIPVVLLNGISGVAVGWSTEILPRSLSGLIQATIDALSEKKTLRGLLPSYDKYDVVVNDLGSNKYEIEGKLKIVDTSTIEITELPPGLQVDSFKNRLIELEETRLINDFDDHSTNTLKFVVKFPRGSVKDWTEADAINFFKLREKKTERIVVVNWDGKSIRTIDDPTTLVREFVQWRLGWYTTRFEKLRDDASHELIYWRLLKALFDNGFTKKLGTFPNKAAMATAVEAVAKKAKLILGEGHLDRALSLATYRWTKEFEAEVGQKITAIEADIAEYIATIASPEKLKSIYMGELEALKKLKL